VILIKKSVLLGENARGRCFAEVIIRNEQISSLQCEYEAKLHADSCQRNNEEKPELIEIGLIEVNYSSVMGFEMGSLEQWDSDGLSLQLYETRMQEVEKEAYQNVVRE
jgi:hypothetical protein